MPYGRFDIDVHAAFEKAGVKAKEQTVYVDDETVIRMVGKGLGISMMSELMIRGNTDDVCCVPVAPKSIRELGMGTEEGRGTAGECAEAEGVRGRVYERLPGQKILRNYRLRFVGCAGKKAGSSWRQEECPGKNP